jgi:hypothetical protein
VDDCRNRFRQYSGNHGERIMRLTRKTASILLTCAGLFLVCFSVPAISQERGNAADFAGEWQTVIPKVNARYKIVLRVDRHHVTGDVYNTQDSQYNGSITGTVDPSLDGTPKGGRLDFFFVQPIVGQKSTGYFIVAVDGTIAGFVSTEGDSKKYGWEGKRVSGGNTKPTPPAAAMTRVKQAVDMYETENDQNLLRSLPAGTMVQLIRCNANDRCNVVDQGQQGWIYDGAGYDTLDR